jgi:hypothetical protein
MPAAIPTLQVPLLVQYILSMGPQNFARGDNILPGRPGLLAPALATPLVHFVDYWYFTILTLVIFLWVPRSIVMLFWRLLGTDYYSNEIDFA